MTNSINDTQSQDKRKIIENALNTAIELCEELNALLRRQSILLEKNGFFEEECHV